MKYIKQTPKRQIGYYSTEISREEALQYVSEETLNQMYNDLIRGCGADAAMEKICDGLYIGVTRNSYNFD